MEGHFLSRKAARQQNAGFLRRPFCDDGDQLLLSSDPEREDHSHLVASDAKTLQVCLQGAAAGDPLCATARLRGNHALFWQCRFWVGRQVGCRAVSASTQFQTRYAALERVSE